MQDGEVAGAADGAAQLSRLYVLRLWREAVGAPWRAALLPTGGAAPQGFAGLGQLAAYLRELAGEDGPPGAAPDAEHGEQRAPSGAL